MTWIDLPSHRSWLARGLERLIAFAQPAVLPAGGFAWQDASGHPMPDRLPQLFLTARMTHVAALGVARGIPGSGRLLGHGVHSLLGAHRDHEHGGWFSTLDGDTGQRKQTYDHVHVGLAAASAQAVGHPQGAELLGLVTDVVERHLWDEGARALRESFAADFSDPEPYRGANANMHGVEAFLAIGDVLGESRWHERALAIAERIVLGGARAHRWLVPEHFTADWTDDPDHHRDQPDHPFRPYGATCGHALEWARLLLGLDASPLLGSDHDRSWLRDAATNLTRTALRAWGADGIEGLPYTVDWDGLTVVSALRLHWPICEGIQACGALVAAHGTGSDEAAEFGAWYARLWDHAAAHLIDPRTGAWINELGPDLREAGTLWPGRPDVYHAAGAYVGPTVPPGTFMTLALAGQRSAPPVR